MCFVDLRKRKTLTYYIYLKFYLLSRMIEEKYNKLNTIRKKAEAIKDNFNESCKDITDEKVQRSLMLLLNYVDERNRALDLTIADLLKKIRF